MDNINYTLISVIIGFASLVFIPLFVWGVQAAISALFKNTQELAILNSKIEKIIQDTEKISKLEKDLDALHAWKRSLSGGHNG